MIDRFFFYGHLVLMVLSAWAMTRVIIAAANYHFGLYRPVAMIWPGFF